MEPSFFLAKFWGSLLILIPLCYLFRTESLHKLMRALSNENAILIFVLAGYIAVILGLTTVILHPGFYPNLGLLVTVLGWGSLLCGAAHIIFADKFYLLAQKVEQHMGALKATMVVSLILGVVLLIPF